MTTRLPFLLLIVIAMTIGARADEPKRAALPSLSDTWAFTPLQRPPLPQLAISNQQSTIANPIDFFIRARLTKSGLAPSPEADRRTLLRRVTFDLTGLPPAPEEVEAFANDRRPDAFGRVVDRLLASPQHGERWARHWLDVARFGESQGFEYDKIRDHAWRYRDYVINAFNSDKPYDQFIREQIAGDVLEPVTQDGIVATGFLVGGPWDQAGSGSASPSVRAMVREAELEDIIGTVGQTFLGLTINCARCHDHKFDPIPTRDYYRVKAVFQGVRHGERSILTKAVELQREAEAAQKKTQLAEVEQRLARLDSAARVRVLGPQLPIAPPAVGAPTPPTNRNSLTNRAASSVVLPLARWTFEGDARDTVGSLHARLEGGARIARGRLVLDGKEAFAVTEQLPLPLGEKTLEAWLTLNTLEQGGGGVLSVETDGGQNFDAIAFAERQPLKWMAGSEFYRRTRDLDAADESTTPGGLVHVAITYRLDHTITVFRNGKPYAQPYQWAGEFGAFDTFPAGRSHVLIGKRHTGGGRAMLAGEIEEARLYDRALTAGEIAASFAAGPDAVMVTRERLLAALTEAERREHAGLLAERDRLLKASKAQPAALMAYAAKPDKPELTFILHRGEPDKQREQVTPGALSSVAHRSNDLGLAADAPEAERRRRFADWLASADNPLTARVIVNRVWHYHFGRGLVATPNDFGKMGERPSHPELLDWLAAWFVSPDGANWSLKKLHRLIVASETWRGASPSVTSGSVISKPNSGDRRTVGLSRPDSLNTDALITSFRPRRLDAEAIRDAMLFLSGELNPQMGGPGFRPFRHVGGGGQNEYFASDPVGPEFNRRTVYRIGVHSARDPLLDSLDCPEFSTRTPVRPSTTTPLQALSLMNNSFVQRQSAKLAARVEREAGPDVKEQVKQLWLRCYAREPRANEEREATRLAQEHGLASAAWAVFNSNEFVFLQ